MRRKSIFFVLMILLLGSVSIFAEEEKTDDC